MTRALLPFDKRKVAKPRPRKAPLQKFSSIAKPSFPEAVAAAKKLRQGSKRPNKVNRRRKVSEFARAYGSRQRVSFVKQYACLVNDAYCVGEPIENAHTANGGMGRKADANTIVPLCRWHHRQIHRHGVGTFQAAENLDLAKAAARVERDWQKYLAGERAE